jgi:hypothetical protein
MTEFGRVLRSLSEAGVEFIVVGGIAANAHGSARAAQDIDVVYRRSAENMGRLASVLAPWSPYPRGAPPGLPFRWDEQTIRNGLNFTLTSELGAIVLLGEITGGGGYEQLLDHSVAISIFGSRYPFLDLEKLIEVKRAAGRPKDFEALAELEAILEEQRRRTSQS